MQPGIDCTVNALYSTAFEDSTMGRIRPISRILAGIPGGAPVSAVISVVSPTAVLLLAAGGSPLLQTLSGDFLDCRGRFLFSGGTLLLSGRAGLSGPLRFLLLLRCGILCLLAV